MTNSSLPATYERQTRNDVVEVIDLPVVDVVDRSLRSYPADTLPDARSGMTKDLNVIQQAVLKAQARRLGWGEPADPSVISEPLMARVPLGAPPGLTVHVTAGGEVVADDLVADQAACLSTVVGDTFYLDLSALQTAVLHRMENGGHVAPNARVYVDNRGEVMLGSEAGGHTRASSVVGDTFYVDLNAIQRAVLEQQQNGGQVADKDRVYVDNNGEVMLGSEVGDHSRASSVVGDTFYARDLAVEAYTAQNKMPAAVKVSDGTYEGYAYSIHNDFSDSYDLFIYYHPSYRVYRVALVSPRMGGDWDPHGGHLWPDGTLCLTHNAGSGYPSMEQTYAKSVLWTYGASLYRRGYGFQFNIGQDGDSRA